jgi:Tfp pilus assembly protein FimT
VIALAAAVTAPSIGRTTESLRTRAEVAGFSAFLRRAREHAVVSGRERTVTVDPGARLVIEEGGETVRAKRTFSEQLTIEPDPPEAVAVRFSPFGTATGGSFRLSTVNGGAYRVTIEPLTGRVVNRREVAR